MKRHVLAVAAAGAMLLGANGGVSASADQNHAPYEKSCVGIINSFMASEIGLSPAEAVALYPEWFGSVREYQELQRGCDQGLG